MKIYLTEEHTKYGWVEVEVLESSTLSTGELLGHSFLDPWSREEWERLASFNREGRGWHATREAAVAYCEAQRAKRIASLERQLARLRRLDFSRPGNPDRKAGE